VGQLQDAHAPERPHERVSHGRNNLPQPSPSRRAYGRRRRVMSTAVNSAPRMKTMPE